MTSLVQRVVNIFSYFEYSIARQSLKKEKRKRKKELGI